MSFDTILDFPNGWIRDTQLENSPFQFKLSFKHLFIIYKESSNLSEGSVVLYVDDGYACTLSGYRTFGWNNPSAKAVYSGDECIEHLVEIKMAKKEEAKDFTILAFGYC